jgi:hypothetical protein
MELWRIIVCCAFLISSCHGIGVPKLRIGDLVAASDVIATAYVDEVKDQGPAVVMFRGHALAARKYAAEVNVLSSLKGSVSSHLSVTYNLPEMFVGYRGLQLGIRTIFLKRNGGELNLADPYHPDMPAVVGARSHDASGDYVSAVEQGMLGVIASPTTTNEKLEILRFDYALPEGASTITALKLGLTNSGDEDLVQRIEGELIRFGDLSELPNVVSLLLSDSAASNERVWLLYIIGNEITSARAIPSLQRLLRSANDAGREAAAQALWHIATPSAVPILAAALEDPDQSVRFYAVRGCADIARESGWGGPGEAEFHEHEQQYLEHWKSWAKSSQKRQ